MGISTPLRIEAFDNSHMHGTDAVSAMVVFIDGKPAKRSTENIKRVQRPSMMITVQCRRLYVVAIYVF